MSDHQSKRTYHPKTNSDLSTNALSDAFRKAGISANSFRAPNKTDVQMPESSPASLNRDPISDKELFLRAIDGATPLSAEVGPTSNDRGKSVRPKRAPTLQENQKNRSKFNTKVQKTKNTQPPRSKAKVPEVIYRIGPDGRKRVVITGTWLEFGENNKPTKRPTKIQSTELVVNGTISISQSLFHNNSHSHFSHFHAAWFNFANVGNSDGGEAELVIGLDFGTAYCKVVVQDAASFQAWAIPFSANEHNPYTLATKIWEREGNYFLDPIGTSFSNLKMVLLGNNATSSDKIRAIAFIALVIRHAKNWILKNKKDQFSRLAVLWRVHLGIPTRNYENAQLVDKFKRILSAAMLLAEKDENTINTTEVNIAIMAVDDAWQRNHPIISLKDYGKIHKDQVDLYPEMAAQIFGFLKSEYRDPSQEIFMLVDVGGGTVDTALFQVIQNNESEPTFVFRASAVEKLGVYMLHRERIYWLIDQLSKTQSQHSVITRLRALNTNNVMPDIIPGLIENYLSGVQYPDLTSDSIFYRHFAQLLWNDIITAARNKFGSTFGYQQRIQYLLCGGGRSIGLYNRFIKLINSSDSNSQIRLHPIEMGIPRSLQARNISLTEFHRLSVAYGLSFPEIGKIVTPNMLKAADNFTHEINYRDFYIGKEMM